MKRILTIALLLVSTSIFAQESAKIEAPKFSGYAQLSFNADDESSEFTVQRVRTSIKGTLTDKFLYAVQVNIGSSFSLVDAFVAYTPTSAINLKLGQYKVPFSIENTDCSPTSMEFINYPMGLRVLMGDSKLYSSGSSFAEIGFTAYGAIVKGDGFDILSYDLGVFNGEGGNTGDSNTSKDISARLRVRPIKDLLITASYYYGETGADFKQRSVYSGGIQYKTDKFVVRSEYFGGSRTYSSYGDTELNSAYALFGYNIISNLTAAVRYDTFFTELSSSDTNQTNYTVGLSYKPIKNIRVMFNYTYETFDYQDDASAYAVTVFGMF